MTVELLPSVKNDALLDQKRTTFNKKDLEKITQKKSWNGSTNLIKWPDVPNGYIQISKEAMASIYFRGSYQGKVTCLKLATFYPDTDLKQIKGVLKEASKRLECGRDVKSYLIQARSVKGKEVKNLSSRWDMHIAFRETDKKRPVSVERILICRGTFTKHIAPLFGEYTHSEILPQEWVNIFESIESSSVRDIAITMMRVYYDWEISNSDSPVQANPIAGIKSSAFKKTPEQKVTRRSFNEFELSLLLKAIQELPARERSYLMLHILTGGRAQEIAEIKKNDSFKPKGGMMIWGIGAGSHKAGRNWKNRDKNAVHRAILRPLTPLAESYIDIARNAIHPDDNSELLFPNNMSHRRVTDQLSRKYISIVCKNLHEIVKNKFNHDLGSWNCKAFRKTQRTMFAELPLEVGALNRREMAEFMIGHLGGDVYETFKEKSEIYLPVLYTNYELWSNKILSLLNADSNELMALSKGVNELADAANLFD